MEAIIGAFLLIALILSILTHRTRQQTLEIKKLEKRNESYIKIILELKQKNNGKEETQERETGEAD